MRQLVFIALLAVILLACVGALLLGAFPPHPTAVPVAHTLPNDRFGTH